MQQCQVNFHFIFAPSFDPNEWCLKNGLHSGGLNPAPLGHESSALTTRPRLLALSVITLSMITLSVYYCFLNTTILEQNVLILMSHLYQTV